MFPGLMGCAYPASLCCLVVQAATLRVGNYEGEEVFTPFKNLLPMVDPNDFVIGGWDISGLNMAEAMERAKVRMACRLAVQQHLSSLAG